MALLKQLGIGILNVNIMNKSFECCILGAGPAGLGAAVELIDNGVTDLVMIDRNSIVGGLARTETFENSKFDIGPHRFFTKNPEINKLWHQTLGPDFIPVDRKTRILYNNNMFNYPISAFDTLIKLGIIESSMAFFSYLKSSMMKSNDIITFEDWITDKFGRRLYEIFFKTYTEKVWGIPCNQIGKQFAEQRIKGLDITEVLKNAVTRKSNVKTLIDQFDYPILGAGQMYEALAEKVISNGGQILLDCQVIAFNESNGVINNVEINDRNGQKLVLNAKQYFNSIPLTNFFKMIYPSVSKEILEASSSLYYRDHITVNLSIDKKEVFSDQWIYVHDPEVEIARITNYKNFSDKMVSNNKKTTLSVEYFAFQDENIWQMNNDDIVKKAIEELSVLGLVEKTTVEQGWVIRETESYPTYYLNYEKSYNKLKDKLKEYKNIYSIGRGGMYKYNNQDHSTYSGILAARNYLKLPGTPYNLWDINIDAEYHEGAERTNK
jgi:protoporphyrinogen oxidase